MHKTNVSNNILKQAVTLNNYQRKVKTSHKTNIWTNGVTLKERNKKNNDTIQLGSLPIMFFCRPMPNAAIFASLFVACPGCDHDYDRRRREALWLANRHRLAALSERHQLKKGNKGIIAIR